MSSVHKVIVRNFRLTSKTVYSEVKYSEMCPYSDLRSVSLYMGGRYKKVVRFI